MSETAFEYSLDLPNEQFDKTGEGLLGFDARYARLEKRLRLIGDPAGLAKWARGLYKGKIVPPIFELVGNQYPLFIFEGDVGTGKTEFAKSAASRFCTSLRREGHFFALSTRVRGGGHVGEASLRINEAFVHITSHLGKSKFVFLLIDEADSLLTTRAEQHSHLEDRVAVNTIIQKVDFLRQHGGRLIVFLATNRLDSLDPAILRRTAMIERFDRPNTDERKELLEKDLAGLELNAITIGKATARTGPKDGSPGYTYSDFRTRLLPQIVSNAYPDGKISDKNVLDAISETKPSPRMS